MQSSPPRFRLAMALWLACFGVYLASAVSLPTFSERILIPADRPDVVTEPMRVDTLTHAGARGIRIPANVGRGWCREAGGMARYTFFVPTDGAYTLWAFCLWGGACTNAVYVQIDDSAKVVFGNDPLYDQWHWVRGTIWSLRRGTHTLVLSNHSDGIAIQRLLLLSDPLDSPEAAQNASYNLFYEGFDGCDGGSFANWKTSGEQWRLHEPTGRQDFAQRVLAGTAALTGPPAIACIGQNAWPPYTVNLKFRMEALGKSAIGFNYQDIYNCLILEWQWTDPRSDLVTLALIQVNEGRRHPMGEIKTPLMLDRWYELDVRVSAGIFQVRVDGTAIGYIPFTDVLKGRLALIVSEGACVWFDDIHVRLVDRSQPHTPREPLHRKGTQCEQNQCKQ